MTVRQVAAWVGGTVEGDGSKQITALAALDAAGPDELVFAVDEKRAARLADSPAAAAIVTRSAPPAPMPLIRVDNVEAAVAALLAHLGGGEELPPVGVDRTAVVAEDAEVPLDAAIGANVSIGPRATIGAGCSLCANVVLEVDVVLGRQVVLGPGVVIRHGCRLGDRVRIGPNSVIGSEGFGYYFADGVHHKVPHIGNVVIDDDVEIGACSCVDRAKFGSTRIGAGTKIDNLVQIAHNVQIGRGCILAALCGIAGSATIGDGAVLMGHAGVRDNVTVGRDVQCSAFAAVAADVPDGEAVAGIPAGPARNVMRAVHATAKLPELLKRVKALEARLQALVSSKDH